MKLLMQILALALFTTTAWAQSSVESALAKGDAANLARHFDARVELSIGDDEGVYPKQEAQAKLNNFFRTHQVSGYEEMHSGSSKGQNANYTIGRLKTSKGEFRVYTYYGTSGDKQVIRELRIER